MSTKALGGPVLIAQASYESAKSGLGKLIYFLAIISINLAVLNILPVPVLDGGHLLFIGVEKIKGSPVSEKTLVIANYVGFAMIISLMIYATKNDIMRILIYFSQGYVLSGPIPQIFHSFPFLTLDGIPPSLFR